MKVTLSLQLRKSAKTGKFYPALCADLGYREVNLVIDRSVLAELFDVSPYQFNAVFERFVLHDRDLEDRDVCLDLCSYDTSCLSDLREAP